MNVKLTNKAVSCLVPRSLPYEVRDSELKGFLVRVQPSGKMVYYLSYTSPDGKRQRYRIGTHGTLTAVQARDAAEQHAGKVALGTDIQREKKADKVRAARQKAKTLSTFLDTRYQPWIESQRKTGAHTIKRLRRHFSHLLAMPLDEIDVWLMEKWRTERRKSGTNPVTINRDIADLRALLSKAVEWNIIDQHPLLRLKPLKTDNKSKIRFLDKNEEQRLRTALDKREQDLRAARASGNVWRKARGHAELPAIPGDAFADHLTPMVLLAKNTGIRRGEMFDLRWEHVDFARATVTIVGATAKSGKTRHIPLNSEALSALKRWKKYSKKSPLVFPSKDGCRFDNISTSWESLMESAEITDFTWHCLRHDFASQLVMAGVDLNTVRELMGHSSIQMTLRYAHLAPEHKAEAVSRLVSAPAGTSTTSNPKKKGVFHETAETA